MCSPNRKTGLTNNTPSDYAYPILYNYIRYTYRRLAEENKIALSEDDRFPALTPVWSHPIKNVSTHPSRLTVRKVRNRGSSRVGFGEENGNSISFLSYPTLPITLAILLVLFLTSAKIFASILSI